MEFGTHGLVEVMSVVTDKSEGGFSGKELYALSIFDRESIDSINGYIDAFPRICYVLDSYDTILGDDKGAIGQSVGRNDRQDKSS